MGKIKRIRQKYHTRPSVKKEEDEDTQLPTRILNEQQLMPVIDKTDQISTKSDNMFAGLQIKLKGVNPPVADTEDSDRMSMSSTTSAQKGFTKKERRKQRKEAFLQKIDTVRAGERAEKERKKRENTVIVGDVHPLIDALPTLEELVASTCNKKHPTTTKVRSTKKEKHATKDIYQSKKAPKRKFRDVWLHDEEFQPWLRKVEGNPERAYCQACRSEMSAELSSFKRHKMSKFHNNHITITPNTITEPSVSVRGPDERVTRAELKLATFMAEHNIALNKAGHLVDMLKNIFPDSKIAQHMSLKRSKTTKVLKEISKISQRAIVDDLKRSKFSIIIDEMTDISTSKTCAVVVKYHEKSARCIQTRLLDLLDINGLSNKDTEGSTGQHLFQLLMNFFNEHEIPVENMIGFVAGGASNIMGEHNSVVSCLRSVAPGITVLKCICYSIHLCVSQAAKTLPRICEDLIRGIYTYISHSSKRKSEFQEFQSFCNVKPHELLNVAQTQWLSLHMAVSRVVEQWRPLTLYFAQKQMEDRLTTSKIINDGLKDTSVYLYYMFLNFILPKFNSLNLLFQKREPTIHLLHNSCQTLYLDILRCFYKNDLLNNTDITLIDPSNAENYIPLEQIFLGDELHRSLQTPDIYENKIMITDVRSRCRQFMVTSCVQMKTRFPLDSKFLKLCSALSVPKCLSDNALTLTPTLYDLASEVPRIYTNDLQELDNEWRSIPVICIPNHLKKTNNPEVFFNGLSEMKNNEGDPIFTVLPQFALNILALPTSNADVERIFSKVNLTKTQIRNKLLTSTQSALVIVSESVKRMGGCVSFEPTKDMMKAMQRPEESHNLEEGNLT